MTNKVLWSLCRFLISVGRRRAVPPPDILELWHYATCPRCREEIEAQGWCVHFKHKGKKVYEVTFSARKNEEDRELRGYVSDDEEEDEDEDDESGVKRPTRLRVGFYV